MYHWCITILLLIQCSQLYIAHTYTGFLEIKVYLQHSIYLIIFTMPRLTEGVKNQIIALRDTGMSWKQICSQLNVKQTTTWDIVAKFKATGSVSNKPACGRPRKITAKSERFLARIVIRDRRASLSEVTESYNHGRQYSNRVCARTVQRALHRCGFRGRLAAKKLGIAATNRRTRIRWCRLHRANTVIDWSRVIFTDEVRIGFRPDGGIRVWRKKGERYLPGCTTTTSTSRASIMFWGFISWDGVGRLFQCSNRMSAFEYISVMNSACIFALPSFNLTYMDDNAPIHRANVVKKWKEDNGVECLDWPPYSPDLNPIENVWSFLKHRLNKLPTRPQNLDELCAKVFSLWDTVPVSYVQRLYSSLPSRMDLCLKNHGFPINY
jgi:transposase